MDAAAQEFVRLCEIALGEAQRYRDQVSLQRRERLAKKLALLQDVLRNLQQKALNGTLKRPSGGMGLGLSREISEWNVDGSSLDAAVRNTENYYMDHM